MPDLTSDAADEWFGVIGRALAFLCLHAAELRDKELAVQAAFLQGLGLSRSEAAKMLGTSADSLRVLEYQAKKKGGKGGRQRKAKK